MDVPRESLCPLCLRPKPDEGACPHCHWPGDVLRSSPLALAPGTVLAGRYRTGKVLGQGGFALTYLALDQSLDIRLCLKEYFPANMALRGDDGFVGQKDPERAQAFNEGRTRFLHEARILARFEGHPGIVPVRDVFEERGTVYIVTGYLEGATLKQFLRERGGKIAFDRALALFMPVMDSLRAVHKAQVVHRDVTPENIFLTTEGQVKLLDFGSALALDGADRGFTVVVKPGYAPAEQYEEGGDQGPWTDVYGLAASLYRALTGVLPPTGPERAAGEPLKSPSELGLSLSASQESVLLKALSEAPQDRYRDMESFQKALVEAQSGGARPEKKARHERGGGLFVAAFLLFVALGLGGWWGWNGLSPNRLEERGRALVAAGEAERGLLLLERALARSPEPQRELYLALAEAQIASGEPGRGLASLAEVERLGGLPPRGLLLAGEAHQSLGEKEKALAFFREAARITGHDISLWLRTAQSAVTAGRLDAADEAWKKALSLDPQSPEALEGLATVAERRGKLDEAIAMRRQLVEESPSVEGWRGLASLLERQGNDRDLAEVLQKIVELKPGAADWSALGRVLARQGDFAGAAEAFRSQVGQAPEDGEGWRDLGLALLQVDRAEEAANALYRASALRSGDALLWEGLGRAWKRTGRFREAEGAYRRALEIDGSRQDWWDELGLSLMEQRRFPEALEAFQKSVSGQKGKPVYGLHLAQALFASGRNPEAKELLRGLMAESATFEGTLLLGRILEGEGNLAEALPAYEAARRLDRKAVAPLLAMGRVLVAAKKPDRALPPLQEALRLSPDEKEAHLLAGRACLDLKKPDQALIHLKEYLRLEPNDDEGWRLLGEAYLRQGKSESTGPEKKEPSPAPRQEVANETVAKPAVEPAAKPVEKQAAQPVAQPVAKPMAEPVAEPVAVPVAVPVAEPAAEPVAEPVVEPAAEPTAEPVDEPAAEPVDEPATEPADEPAGEPADEPAVAPGPLPPGLPSQEPPQEQPLPPLAIPGRDRNAPQSPE